MAVTGVSNLEKLDSIKDWCDKLPQYLTDKEERSVVVICKEVEVGYGDDCDFNKEYCDLYNIPYYNRGGDGGTIVFSKGNVAVGFVYNNRKYRKWMLTCLLDDLSVYFKSLGLNSARSRNDILIDGYKVASGCAINLKPDFKWTYEAVQISVNQEIELIQNICTKPMAKMPRALSEYGITTEEIAQWCSEWLTTHLGISLADSAQT